MVDVRRNFPFALLLNVYSAEGLRAGDWTGKSDPYCRVITEQEGGETVVQETSVRWQTLDPVWDEEFEVKDLYPGSGEESRAVCYSK